MEQYFDLGAGVVRVTAAEGIMDLSQGAISAFSVEPREADLHLTMSLAPVLPVPRGRLLFHSPECRVYDAQEGIVTLLGSWEDPYMRICRRGKESHAQLQERAMKGPIFSRLVLRAVEIEHLAAASGALLLHSSFISCRGQAIVFTAPCETGKSTQAELWRVHRGARVCNGDRSALRKHDGVFYARGLPYCGTSGIYGPAKVPLAAVVVLSQAPENSIRPLCGAQAFRGIWEGCSVCSWSPEETEQTAELLTELIRQVPVYHLACTPDERAVRLLEQQLQRGGFL